MSKPTKQVVVVTWTLQREVSVKVTPRELAALRGSDQKARGAALDRVMATASKRDESDRKRGVQPEWVATDVLGPGCDGSEDLGSW